MKATIKVRASDGFITAYILRTTSGCYSSIISSTEECMISIYISATSPRLVSISDSTYREWSDE